MFILMVFCWKLFLKKLFNWRTIKSWIDLISICEIDCKHKQNQKRKSHWKKQVSKRKFWIYFYKGGMFLFDFSIHFLFFNVRRLFHKIRKDYTAQLRRFQITSPSERASWTIWYQTRDKISNQNLWKRKVLIFNSWIF